MLSHNNKHLWLIAALVAAIVAIRILPHPWNVTPVTALALFSGAYLRSRLGLTILFVILILSDLALGWHVTAPFTWTSFLLIHWLGRGLKERSQPARLIGYSLLSSTLFFVISNAGVFLVAGLYPWSVQGAVDCYTMALPFYRNALAGDLVYVSILFGLHELAMRRHVNLASHPQPSGTSSR